jgi:hypothetical protein
MAYSEVLAAEIVEALEATLEQFNQIAGDRGEEDVMTAQ